MIIRRIIGATFVGGGCWRELKECGHLGGYAHVRGQTSMRRQTRRCFMCEDGTPPDPRVTASPTPAAPAPAPPPADPKLA